MIDAPPSQVPPSSTHSELSAAVRWLIVGIALGVLPTYVLMGERAKKESAAAASAAASVAASNVYAAWKATPIVTCPPPPPVVMPTVLAVSGNGAGGNTNAPRGPTRTGAPAAPANEIDDAQMMGPMLNMMQGMMQNGDLTGGTSGAGTPDVTELMKNMPKK